MDAAAFAAYEKSTATGQRGNLLRRPQSSTLPTVEEQKALPFHSKTVDTMKLGKLRSMMSDKRHQRWSDLWRMLTRPDAYGAVPSTRVAISRDFLPAHAQKLAADGIAHRVDAAEETQRPTRAGGRAFCVKETKPEGERLRAIYWPKYLNEVLDKHYAADMDLQHVSQYTDAGGADAACCGDLAISFFQVEIPPEFRPWFRFRAADGVLYEYTRLPMGHKVSAELMQIAVETVAGMAHACTNDLKHTVFCPKDSKRGTRPDLVTHVWIDGFRTAGTTELVAAAFKKIRANADHVGVTWKPGTFNAAKQYDFNGVHFDHVTKKVRVAGKTMSKLRTFRGAIIDRPPASARISEYEAMTSRLIFCAGVLDIPLAYYYNVIKCVNRYINRLNRTGDDEEVNLARECPYEFKRLSHWFAAAKRNKRINRPPGAPRYDIVYCDASTKGWGCYIILASGELIIHGGKWPKGTDVSTGNMAVLEARAVSNTFEACGHRLTKLRDVDLRIDNSSVVAGLRRGIARSANLNASLVHSLRWLDDHKIEYTVQYVRSIDNLSDGPSRGDFSLRDEEYAPAWVRGLSRGAVGRAA